MSTASAKTHFTPEDLLKMPDGDRFELVDGQLVERHMGFRAGRIAGRLYALIDAAYHGSPPGWLLPGDVGYQCFPDSPHKVRIPDLSFISFTRLPIPQEPEGYCPVFPDLAVEVVSPNDLSYDVEEKIREFLGAGVKLVWTIHPVRRTVQVDRADGTSTILHENDELTGENVLPGFHCRVRDIFRVPEPAPRTV
jgi:Uma2 family endonuclease